ncbi:MAG: efflux RND transporter permease subunit [Candidatus Omnitrophica bacterium]|nr:efflux RND transporter permease subunit [Candidatus Omnitrophota bacterium]
MTLSDFSIKNPVFAWMLMAALIIFGGISFQRMGVSQMPDVEFPVISVSLTWEGAAPEVMETDVVDVVEDALMSIQGIRDISSSTRQGQATITIEFDLERDIDVALQEVQTKIAQAQLRLPRELDPPIVTKVNPQDQPIMWLGVSGEVPKRDLMEYVQDHLKDRFQTINGVGEIFLGGFLERNLRVWLDADKLEAYQLTVQDVIDAIQREHVEVPAGRIETGRQELNVRAMGEATSVEDFERIIITTRAGQPIYKPIYLKDVATIEDGLADIRRISRINGQTAVGLGIRKQRGANEVAVARRILKRMAEVKRELPKGIDIGVNFDRTRFIEDSINELTFTLILSAILTSLVCWLFLGSWSATLNILLAIPTSIVGSFICLSFLGFTLNTFTLLGLTLAIGIVVDDAIMVLENIVRHRERGEGQVEAARLGARQITSAALASTLAIMAIFLPVAFMSGIIGKFFFQFGVTISVAIALSLLEALTLAPMRCSQFLRVGPRRTGVGKAVDAGFQWLSDRYRLLLNWALHHRLLIVSVSIVIFLGSLGLIRIVRKEFVPPQDQSMFLVRLQTPVGSSIEFTDERFRRAEQFTMSRPEVKRYFGAIGGFGGGEVSTGVLFVTFQPPRKRPVVPPNTHPLTQQELMPLFRKGLNAIPDVKASVQDLSLSGFSAQRGFPIELSIRGPDWEKLAELSQAMERRMAASSLMVDVDTDYLTGIPEVRVYPDRQSSAAHGVSIEAMGRTINALIGGERVGKYTRGGRRYDVRVRLVPTQRSRKEDIERLWLWNRHGELVQLKDVVTITERPTLLTITRKNRERAISLFANVAPGKSQADALAEVHRIAGDVLPEGYHAVFGGSTETFRESFQSLLVALWLGVLVAYMVLGSQYNSYLHPVTVLLALPFSISGALIALWIGRQSLNIYSFIGLILLMGIVKKNSILLVDFTNQAREQGLPVREALMQACPTRLRAILMTSLSTIAAAVPPALALGPGAETRIPMAVAVIGGLIFSTLLTLFVVPCAYSLFAKIERKRYRSQTDGMLLPQLIPSLTPLRQ